MTTTTRRLQAELREFGLTLPVEPPIEVRRVLTTEGLILVVGPLPEAGPDAVVTDPMTDYRNGFTDGLAEAKRRLSVVGMHDGKCPEPDKPCTCGLDAAIDNPDPVPWMGVDEDAEP